MTDKYRRYHERHNMTSVRLTGEAHAALTAYKQKHGLSFSDAILELLSKKDQ